MEDFIKFVFYAIIFVIYIVSQVRKGKKKQEEAREEQAPSPVWVEPQPLKRKASMDSSERLREDKQFRKLRESKPSLLKKKSRQVEVQDKRVEYKSLTQEGLEEEATLVNRVLSERRNEEAKMKQDRFVLPDEHLDPYAPQKEKTPEVVVWIRNTSNLKKAFIASEVFQRKS